jgi:hypothetical protein
LASQLEAIDADRADFRFIDFAAENWVRSAEFALPTPARSGAAAVDCAPPDFVDLASRAQCTSSSKILSHGGALRAIFPAIFFWRFWTFLGG